MEIILFLVGMILGAGILFFVLRLQVQLKQKQLQDALNAANDLRTSLESVRAEVATAKEERQTIFEQRESDRKKFESDRENFENERREFLAKKESEIQELRKNYETLQESARAELDNAKKNAENQRESDREKFEKERNEFLAKKDSEIKELNEKYEKLQESAKVELERVKKSAAEDLKAERDHFEERVKKEREHEEQNRKTAAAEFSKISEELLKSRSQEFLGTNLKQMENILNPLKEKIKTFEEQVQKNYKDENDKRIQLSTRIEELLKTTNSVSEQANQLANALKAPKSQGNWGEMLLETILENSGLHKGLQYEMQVRIKDDSGKTNIPDAVVRLPGKRQIIIDSKVSLTAYNEFSANDQDKTAQEKALKNHLESVRKHIDELAAKHYEDKLENSADFTMMFVPIEPAYLLAVQSDPELWKDAYKKHVILVSPTTLIACLKLFADLWRHEEQNRNALKIAEQGKSLLEKFTGFLNTFESVGVNLNRAKESFEKAKGQLMTGRGNVISQCASLKQLGVKANKEIPESFQNFDNNSLENEAEIGVPDEKGDEKPL